MGAARIIKGNAAVRRTAAPLAGAAGQPRTDVPDQTPAAQSPVMKMGRVLSGPGARGAAFNLEDVSQHAGRYLESARNEARRILAEAEQQAEALRSRAADEGRQAAIEFAERGLQGKIDEQLQTLLPALREAITSIEQSKHAWLKQWERRGVQLAIHIAQRVIRREIARQPEIALDLVREALELSAGHDKVTLHLHPADHQSLGTTARTLVGQLQNVMAAEIVADESVTPGGCLVTTQFGSVDQRIESQLARIEEELTM